MQEHDNSLITTPSSGQLTQTLSLQASGQRCHREFCHASISLSEHAASSLIDLRPALLHHHGGVCSHRCPKTRTEHRRHRRRPWTSCCFGRLAVFHCRSVAVCRESLHSMASQCPGWQRRLCLCGLLRSDNRADSSHRQCCAQWIREDWLRVR